MDDVTREMGYSYYALLHHVDLSHFRSDLTHMKRGEMVALSSYPESWIEIYLRDQIVNRDPVLLASHRTNAGFYWHEMPNLIRITKAPREVREATLRAGIEDGFTVPAHVPGEANGSCNFAMARGLDVPRGQRALAQAIGAFAFSAARTMVENASGLRREPRRALTPRVLDCIVLSARGTSYWEIGKILALSTATVKRHMEIAREHYDVTTKEQVIAHALFEGQIALSDLIK